MLTAKLPDWKLLMGMKILAPTDYNLDLITVESGFSSWLLPFCLSIISIILRLPSY